MPINSPKKDDYSQLLTEMSKLTLTGTGASSTGFRYVKSAEITLVPNQGSIILGSAFNIVRQVYLINNSDEPVQLFWNDGDNVAKIPEEIEPGGLFQDWSDGGLELRAKSSGEANLKLLVRSNKTIDYQVGIIENNTEEDDEMPINLLINNGLKMNGGQLFYADSFRDGNQYNFTFSTNGIDINNNFKVYLFPITFLSIPQVTFSAQRDSWGNYPIDTPWQLNASWEYDQMEMLDNSRVHHIITPDIEIPFGLSFFRSKFIIAFGSLISIPGIGEDDQLFNDVEYVPNTDPLLGGTFVLNSILPQ
ncbi:MAG TPA: hypothetical protein V6D21_03100 [Candidatus Obscuribacterales bacterium]